MLLAKEQLFIKTFVEEKDFCYFEKYFEGFNLKWKSAKRDHVFGRAKGGCLFGVKKKNNFLNKVVFDFVNLENFDIVQCKVGMEEFYILPVYMRINEWQIDFESIINLLDNYPNYKFVIVGDCNIRIGSG